MEDGQHAETLVETLDLIKLASEEILVHCQHLQAVREAWDRAGEAIVTGIEQIQPGQS